jgi:hypothetical protein
LLQNHMQDIYIWAWIIEALIMWQLWTDIQCRLQTISETGLLDREFSPRLIARQGTASFQLNQVMSINQHFVRDMNIINT